MVICIKKSSADLASNTRLSQFQNNQMSHHLNLPEKEYSELIIQSPRTRNQENQEKSETNEEEEFTQISETIINDGVHSRNGKNQN